MSDDSSARRANSQDGQAIPASQASQMSTFAFTPSPYQQREMQKNFVFVDEHNRHKRLKVMRACEGCRRRKIKCDAATTNTWPCSACIRLKLHCVRPNGFDDTAPAGPYDNLMTPDQFQQMQMQMQLSPQSAHPKGMDDPYAADAAYSDPSGGMFNAIPYDPSQPQQQDIHYTTVPPNLVDNHFVAAQSSAFPTPPMHQGPRQDSSPDAHSVDSYQQQDLANLLGGLKLNELGTAPYLRSKASFRRGDDEPVVEEDGDYGSALPPIAIAPGSKIRIPPELMPDDETAQHYFDLYFEHIHPFVPVLYKPHFYQQWRTARHTISPLILEAIFAIGGRLTEEPAMGQQWLALASRHADAFMDTPRLSTLQALLIILKAREGTPKRGYFWRSWMTVVQCIQMAKDLGLDEHYEDHQLGHDCDCNPTDCHLRTRIWQTIFVCEIMIGGSQGRHDFGVGMDTVDFNVPAPIPGGDEVEYSVSRNFVYFARVARNIGRMTKSYSRLRKRKDWGIDPEFQQLEQTFRTFTSDLPQDMAVTYPTDNSPPWLPSCFVGNLLSYHQLTIILFHRPPLSFLDPNANSADWKKHMVHSYKAAKAVCLLQEAVVKQYGLTGLQCIQRGFSFPLYAGLSCIVIHLVAIVSPDPDLNTDAREFFTRHMRIVEQVMEAWPMPELQAQVDTVRHAFSADIRKPFLLKPSFPYSSPQPSTLSSPPQVSQGFNPGLGHTGSFDPPLDTRPALVPHYGTLPVTPPTSTGPMGSKTESPSIQTIDLTPQNGHLAAMQQQNLAVPDHNWNPSKIFEQWNTTFAVPPPPSQTSSANMGLSPEGSEVAAPGIHDVQSIANTIPVVHHQISPQDYSGAANFVTPAMWQESVASVYEGGLKRSWDYDEQVMIKRE